MRSRLALLGGLLLVALVARGAATLLLVFDGQVHDESLITESGYSIAASIYAPSRQTVPGAVVLCHGISAARSHMDPMARSLARRGLLVVSFDYGGHGRSQDRPVREDLNVEDVRTAIALARRNGARAVALVGHSMGVTSAAAASLRDHNVVCVVALGQRPFVSTTQPQALLMADGAMDPFHPYPNLQSVASEAAGQPVHAQQTVVDPASGAIRRLFLSGSCEHAGEVYDGAILGELAVFVEDALVSASARSSSHSSISSIALPPSPSLFVGDDFFSPSRSDETWRAPTSVSLRFVSNLSALVALILVGLAVAERRRLAPRQAVLGVTLAPIAALGLARLLASPGWGELGASLLIAPFVVGALFSRRTRGESTPWQPIARVATVVLGGWLGGTTLGAAPAFLERPELLLDLPLYVWQGIAFRVEFTVDALAARLAVGNSWPSALGLLALLAVESAWPGRLLQAACGFVTRGVNALGGDFGRAKTPEDAAPSAADPTAKRRNAILAAVLVVLLIVAGTLFAKRAQEGLLAEEGALGIILSASLRMLLLPLVAGALTLWTGRGLHTLWRRRHLEPIATGFIDSPPNAP